MRTLIFVFCSLVLISEASFAQNDEAIKADLTRLVKSVKELQTTVADQANTILKQNQQLTTLEAHSSKIFKLANLSGSGMSCSVLCHLHGKAACIAAWGGSVHNNEVISHPYSCTAGPAGGMYCICESLPLR